MPSCARWRGGPGILAARTLIENEPNYAKVSARLLNDKLRREALSFLSGRPEQATQDEMAARYADYFLAYIKRDFSEELIDPELCRFDIARISAALLPEPDLQFDYLGQLLYHRYLMRVAMGLTLLKVDSPAAGFVDIEIRCSTGLESGAATTKAQPRVNLETAQLKTDRSVAVAQAARDLNVQLSSKTKTTFASWQ